MMTPHIPTQSPGDRERRRATSATQPVCAGIAVRPDDIEQTQGLHSVAILFRVMAGALILLMLLQVISGATSTVEISYGVLIAEAIRLVIFAGLLWGAGDLADLFVKSHCDLRASRILLGRIMRLMDEASATPGSPRPGDAASGRGDGVH